MPDAIEIKDVLGPDDAAALLAQMKAGEITPGVVGPWDKVQKKEFTTGPDAKKEKIAAAKDGFAFVQRGLLLFQMETIEELRLALFDRKDNTITRGGSIAASGSVELPVAEAAKKKLVMDPPMKNEDFTSLGLGLSVTKDGIPYVFDFSAGNVPKGTTVSTKKEPPLQWVTPEEAEQAISEKAAELAALAALLERIRGGASS